MHATVVVGLRRRVAGFRRSRRRRSVGRPRLRILVAALSLRLLHRYYSLVEVGVFQNADGAKRF